jgi:hypothetical protein
MKPSQTLSFLGISRQGSYDLRFFKERQKREAPKGNSISPGAFILGPSGKSIS